MSLPRHIALVVVLALTGGLGLSAVAQAGTPAAASTTAADTQTTVAAVPTIRVRVLRPGATGDDVRKLQQLLSSVGLEVPATGSYLNETARAIQKFQVVSRLKVSGTAGPATIRALRAAARGPRSVEVSGGLSFGREAAASARLGDRIPLAPGMSGRDVKELQDYLLRAGVRGARRPDGEFGSATAKAVRLFEASRKRSSDGTMDAGDMYELLVLVGRDALPGDVGDPSEDLLPPAPLAAGDRAAVDSSTGLASAPENAPDAVKQIIAAGNRIAKLPYRWGGGHSRWEDSGYDCSGSVSYALRGAALLKSPLASYDFFGWGQAGRGQWVTLYTNSGHMYMVVAGLRFDTSGRGPHGSRWQAATRDAGAFRIRHPAGL